MSKNIPYCKEELAKIRGYLEGRLKARDFPDRLMVEKIHKERPDMAPFLSFAKDEKGLFEKVSSDSRVERFSFIMFFPVLENSLDSGMENISFDFLNARTRGSAVRLLAEGKDIIIKRVQSPDEPQIAKYAGERNIGPIQYPTLDGFITEEFMAGELFNRVSQSLDAKGAGLVGERVGYMLGTLHRGKILFNDVIFADDFGGCHLMVEKTSSRMLDFGVSIGLSAFPIITDEQITRYMLTLPMVGEMVRSGMLQGAALERELLKLRGIFAGADVKSILSRDLDFVGEGLFFSRMGRDAHDALERGFGDAYGKASKGD